MRLPKNAALPEVFNNLSKPDGACWIWPHSRNGAGRAMFGGRSAPRQIYEMLHGDLLEDIYVLHKCDNPACVNPDHLFPGTQRDNVHDMMSKGRKIDSGQAPGEAHSLAKLTEEDVIAIRKRAMAGETSDAIARDYCVGETQIHRIITGKRWGHVGFGIRAAKPAPDRVKPDDFYEIRRRRLSGEKLQEVADAFGISIATVSRIANGKVKEPQRTA